MRALDALPVVGGVAGDAGSAGVHAGADAVGQTGLAVLKVEELAGTAHVVVSICRGY